MKATVRTARELGAVVRQARLDARMSQEGLAEKAGVSRPWLSELETGKRTAEVGLVLRVLSAAGLTLYVDRASSSSPSWDLPEGQGRG